VWVDDAGFTIDRHVRVGSCRPPGDESELLEVAAAVAVSPLPRDRPLWSVTVVTGLAGGRGALLLVMHHVLADGLGGLAVLASLVDGLPLAPDSGFPAPPPTARELRAEAAAARLRVLRGWRSGWSMLRAAVGAIGTTGVTSAPRCSLNQSIGPRRGLAVVRSDLAATAAAAHACGGTINDLLLTAVGGALAAAMAQRGESADSFVVSIPVSGRAGQTAARVGNQVGVRLIQVPGSGDPTVRLAATVERTRDRGSPGPAATAALLGPVFRLLAVIGIFRWFVDRQHLVSTFLTNMRGPATPLIFLGATVTGIVPVSAITGNITVEFAALSYAGTLTLTVIADPERCPDLPLVAAAVQEQLDTLTGASTVEPRASGGSVAGPAAPSSPAIHTGLDST
jgi:WS/DGAT/MGAT family acyltransferase